MQDGRCRAASAVRRCAMRPRRAAAGARRAIALLLPHMPPPVSTELSAPAPAAQLHQQQRQRQRALPLATANPAVMQDLRQLGKQRRLFGFEDPAASLTTRLQKVLSELQRARLQVQLGQYDSARMALRQGAASQLRADLAYAQEAFTIGGVTPQAVRQTVQDLERLDAALKRRDPQDEVLQALGALTSELQAIAVSVGRVAEAR